MGCLCSKAVPYNQVNQHFGASEVKMDYNLDTKLNDIAYDDIKNDLTWFDLLNTNGENLWIYRDKTLPNNNNPTSIYMPVNSDDKKKKVEILLTSKSFKEMEEKHEMDKFLDYKSKALTNVIGDEWKKQRNIIADAFHQYNIKETSIKIAKEINILSFINNNNSDTIIIDLKELTMKIALNLVINLFFGYYNANIADNLFKYWLSVRSTNKNKNDIKDSKKVLLSSLNYDNGLLYYFKNSNLTEKELIDNSKNAMVAAFETTATIIFWTLWNISYVKNHELIIKQCRADNTDKINDIDMKLLSIIKKKSVKSIPFSFKNAGITSEDGLSSLSYLGRALIESVRVYPPVWTLPRYCPAMYGKNDHVISTKLDVLMCNNAVKRNWNPDNNDDEIYIYSWGIGKRYCPGGTTALLAAYVILAKFVDVFDEWREITVDNAVKTAHLVPILVSEGKQLFNCKLKSVKGN